MDIDDPVPTCQESRTLQRIKKDDPGNHATYADNQPAGTRSERIDPADDLRGSAAPRRLQNDAAREVVETGH